MNSDDTSAIQEATNIALSGRGKAVNDKIEQMVANPALANAWSIKVFGPLCFALISEFFALQKAYDKGNGTDCALLAWRARNLFEISIWCTYCNSSDENARRFYEDAGHDGTDLLTGLEKWGAITGQEADWLEGVRNSKAKLAENAQKVDVDLSEGTYTRVRAAAETCGLLEYYNIIFKYLSKFAHPTALQIIGNIPAQKKLRDGIFEQGCVFFVAAFADLEAHFLK